MASAISGHPLAWPAGWKRTAPAARAEARFSTSRASNSRRGQPLSVALAVERVLVELERMGLDPRNDAVVSTNVELRLDGLPRSDRREPDDPGAAVYWQTQGGQRKVIAIDCYTRVADNIAAVAATLDAMRAIERHGGAVVLERAYAGFTALPAPEPSGWWTVLGVPRNASATDVQAAYRRLASINHPDKGGTAAAMATLNAAYAEARKEASHG